MDGTIDDLVLGSVFWGTIALSYAGWKINSMIQKRKASVKEGIIEKTYLKDCGPIRIHPREPDYRPPLALRYGNSSELSKPKDYKKRRSRSRKVKYFRPQLSTNYTTA